VLFEMLASAALGPSTQSGLSCTLILARSGGAELADVRVPSTEDRKTLKGLLRAAEVFRNAR